MIESYNELPEMYQAVLNQNQLLILTVSPHKYMRFGTMGLGKTKLEAIELLRKNIMEQFTSDLNTINWQAKEYGG